MTVQQIDQQIEQLNQKLLGDIFHDAPIMQKIKELEAQKEGREFKVGQCEMDDCEGCK